MKRFFSNGKLTNKGLACKWSNSLRLLILIASLMVGNGTMWGEYYVLSDQGTNSVTLMNSTSKSTNKEYTLSGPGKILTFELEKTSKVATGSFTIKAGDTTIKTIKIDELTKDTWKQYTVDLTGYSNYKTNRKITFSASGTLAKYLRSAKVTMAQYIDDPSSTAEMAWGAGKVDDTNVTKSITIDWCNVGAFTTSLDGKGIDHVSISVTNNASEGNFGTATIKVTYNRNTVSTLDATLNIRNTYGSYSKNIKLSGSTTKYDQTLSWNNESAIELNMLQGSTQNISASSNQGQTVTYTSNNSAVLSVDANGKLTAHAVGTATITASQAGNYKYNTATPITKTFQVKTKDTPIFTPNDFAEGTTKSLKVGDKVTLNVQYVSSGLTDDFKVLSYDSQVLSITRANNTITIEALNEGNSSATFTQTENGSIFSASKTYSFSVTKIDNTLTADATHEMYVGDEWTNVVTNKNNAAVALTTTSSDESLAYYDIATNKIVAQNTNNQSFDSKVVTITISQATNYKYTAANKTILVTVKKHVPTFTWSTAPVYHNQTINDYFTTTGTNALTVKSSSDEDVAYLIDGSSSQKLNLKTLSKTSSTTLTVTQEENYYWAAKTATTTITPTNEPNHVPCTLNESMYNTLKKGTSGEQAWDGGIRIGNPSSGGFNWDDKYCIIGPFAGIPDKFSCEYSCTNAATDRIWKVSESADGNNWSEVVSAESAGSASNIQLKATTRYLKFLWLGNFAGYFKNISITELHTFATNKNELDFNLNRKDVVCPAQTFTFSYANVGHKVTLTTNDAHFTVSPSELTTIGGEQVGTQTITVNYSTTELHLAAADAKITISDELGNSTQVALAGETKKKIQTLTWATDYQGELPTITVGKNIQNAATASSTFPVTYTSSDESIIQITNDGASFKAIAAGTATITAYQAGNEDWEEVSEGKVFKGTNKTIQLINWNQNLTHLRTTDGTVSLTAQVMLVNPETAEQTYSKPRTDLMTYTSGNESVVRVEKEGNNQRIVIVGAGTTTLAASISGSDTYEEAETTMTVIVREPSTGCDDQMITTDLSEEFQFFQMNLNQIDKIVAITGEGKPGSMTFQTKREKWGLNSGGTLEVRESTDGGTTWSNNLYTITPELSTYTVSAPIILSRNATHLKFTRPQNGTGYHYIKDIEITPAQYIEGNAANNTIDFGQVTVNSVEKKNLKISYSNTKGDLTLTSNSTEFIVPERIDLDCGSTGDTIIEITFMPTSVSPKNASVTIRDEVSGKNFSITLTATTSKSSQNITWTPAVTTLYCDEVPTLDATASSTYPVYYYVKEGNDVADFDGNGDLIVNKPGTITLVAYQEGDAIWDAADNVEKSFTFEAIPLTMTTAPTATDIDYLETLTASTLTGGVVENHRNEEVAGTFAWADETTAPMAGENQSMPLTFTPTANTAWYTFQDNANTTVTVNKIAPNAGTPVAEDIDYGMTIGESVLSASDATTNGLWTWDESIRDIKKDAGTYPELAITFIPSGSDANNYTELASTITLTVNKIAAELAWNKADDELTEGSNSTYTTTTSSDGAITYSIEEGTSLATIDAATGVMTAIAAGTVVVKASQATTTNYLEASITQTVTITAASAAVNKFTGDGTWENNTNWSAGSVPTEGEDIIVAGSLVIDGDHTANTFTIEPTGHVTIIENGTLTVLNGSNTLTGGYGDLTIGIGGAMNTQNGTVEVNDLVVKSHSSNASGVGESGQLFGNDPVTVNGNAYIDITITTLDNMNENLWYAFAVPFPVSSTTGISRMDGENAIPCTANVDYKIIAYNSQKRQSTGKGWEYFSGTLQPGQFYMITVANEESKTYRFTKMDGAPLHSSSTLAVTTTGDMNTSAEANWNALGNSTLQHAQADIAEDYVQVYRNGLSTYLTVSKDEAIFVVGAPFFVQAASDETLTLIASDDPARTLYAPNREQREKKEHICLQIAAEGVLADQVFIAPSQDAIPEYVAGSDLAKAGSSNRIAQIWVDAYEQQLSVYNAPIEYQSATAPLTISAPKSGVYSLRLSKHDSAYDTYLLKNGRIIWNLSQSAYEAKISEGTCNLYSLLLIQRAPETATGTLPTIEDNATEKVIINGQLYIIQSGILYDATGRQIR